IGEMQKAGKSIDEIAARLGKSKAFVYGRIKLLSLIDPFREMFLADKVNIQEAFDIASVSKGSQLEFFDEYCKDWKEQKNFELNHLEYSLARFKYDLKQAPFDTKDKKLLPEIGACTHCPSNTATLKTLFPEYAKQAVCTNRECYSKKCTAHFSVEFGSAFEKIKPDALVFNGEPSQMLMNVALSIPQAAVLPRYDRHEVTIFNAPEMPDKADFCNLDEFEEGEEAELDEEGYSQAVEEYKIDLEEFNGMRQRGKTLKGVFVSERGMLPVLFSLELPKNNSSHQSVTAKEVQAAIKAGTVTVELLQAEIDRINSRELRSSELDKEKVQLKVHESFCALIQNANDSISMTTADWVAVRLIIYQSLEYSTRNKVSVTLFSGNETAPEQKENLYEMLGNLTDEQFGYLIRMAVAGNSESKSPNCEKGYFLYQMAAGIGMDIAGIEKEQQRKAEARLEKQEDKIESLQKRIKKLQKTT
ncbi:MAG TPA: hypothetical protein VK543_19575, partial [Puia sp.]|nr:hypothetical protein [Puia sp.]